MQKRNALAVIAVLLLAGPTISFVCANATDAASQESVSEDGRKTEAPATILLQLVISSGLSNAVYVTNSHDGTNRLFVIEKVGRIRVAQPGASTTTLFLDITSRVLSVDNERGLLGLAFHPQYSINGRFFVYYTRQPDGALTISEFHVSSDPNAGDPASEIVFTGNFPIPHSTNTNHNGGTIEFGPDGYLYAGPGDGGGANDNPANNAQNINVLLGKILRIDVDHPNGAVPYSSPPTNPFFGATAGADEIYAYGMRNPYRYSFDRGTGQLYAADVGQSAREEIDIVTPGGNYGWRVMEGMICNPNINGGVCTPPPGSILPIFDYTHSAGRCSIIGGFVYRGSRSAVSTGGYIYGDYCTGEIWQLLSGVNTLLLDTSLNITSFGEDEAGELYVVGQSGTVSRITASPSPPACSFSISPGSQLLPVFGSKGSLTLATAGDCGWRAAPSAAWITLGTTSGVGTNSISFSLSDNNTGSPRIGVIHAGGQTLTIVQEGPVSADCVAVFRPTNRTFTAAGGSSSVNVYAEARCTWSAKVGENWITITSNGVGAGNGMISFTVAPNTGGARFGTITIGKQQFVVKQKGV